MLGKSFFFALLLTVTHAQTAKAQDSGKATVPLEDLLALHASSTEKEQAPPTPAALQRIVIKSRLLRGALKMTAHVELSVLADTWVKVPLFVRNSGLTITEVSNMENGHLVAKNGLISFICQTQGNYAFTIELQQKALSNRGNWRAAIKSFPATVLRMELQHDNTSFDVVYDSSEVSGDTLILLPKEGVFSVLWKEKKLPKTTVDIQSRPKIQPVIEEAFADIVSTLDGQRISRYRYELRLQGTQTLSLAIPKDQTVSKVFLNGISVPFAIDNSTLVTTVSPPQVGGESAVLELVTQTGSLPYSLSGELSFVLPRASWDLNEQYLTLHLPDVFNYKRKGGSLGISVEHKQIGYVHNIPTPGKIVQARQQLVTQKPHLKLLYTVDLEGKYYRGHGWVTPQESR